MQVLSIINTKGGVGKTVTTVHLGAALAARGLRVLLLDLDLQHNLTSYFQVEPRAGSTLADVLLNDLPLREAASTVRPGLFLVPSTSATAEADAQLASAPGGEVRLRRAFWRLKQDPDAGGLFDVALIDCPAGWSSVGRNAVLASERLLVPINCEPAAFHCAVATIGGANELGEYHAHRLEPAWVLLTRLRETRAARAVAEMAEGTWGRNVLDARIRHAERVNELAITGKAGSDVSRSAGGAAVEDYESLASEVMQRGEIQS